MTIRRTLIALSFAVLLSGWSGCVDVETPDDGPDASATVLHVAPKGADFNPGTADRPLRTIWQAMDLAREGVTEVRIATGVYSNGFSLVGGVDIIGGCDPDTWQAQPDSFAVVTTYSSPIAGRSISLDTRIRNLDVRVSTDRSSHALFLTGCGDRLHFVNCRFASGDGVDGTEGPDGSDAITVSPEGSGRPGGAGACADSLLVPGGVNDWTYWGAGGDGGLPGQPGEDGRSGAFTPVGDPGTGGAGGEPGQPGADGLDGHDGADGVDGRPAPARGFFYAEQYRTYQAGSGTDGNGGEFGGGGGGGGGSTTGSGNGGGSGGSGGNGGRHGAGGGGGGHSIALVCRNSSVVFRDCRFTAGDGGDGGDGGDAGHGTAGTPGGSGGTECTDQVGAGGTGGQGGRGGDGGAGAGGHGGSSFAVYVDGAAQPTFAGDCAFAHGEGGAPGRGGLCADGVQRAAGGLAGLAGNVYREEPEEAAAGR